MALLLACGGGGGPGTIGDASVPLPTPACEPAEGGGSDVVAAPELAATLADRWHEAWLASPAVADLDDDGAPEIVIARADLLIAWHMDGTEAFRATVDGRIWASPVVADLRADVAGLEVAAAARGQVHMWSAAGEPISCSTFGISRRTSAGMSRSVR